MRIHDGEDIFACDICDREFTSEYYLNRHIVIHDESKQFNCELCGKNFVYVKQFEKHKSDSNCHRSCTQCGKTYAKSDALRNHMRIHTGDLFTCDICDKGFTSKTHLKQHIEIHGDNKQFSCELCGKEFLDKQQLKKHKMFLTCQKIVLSGETCN